MMLQYIRTNTILNCTCSVLHFCSFTFQLNSLSFKHINILYVYFLFDEMQWCSAGIWSEENDVPLSLISLSKSTTLSFTLLRGRKQEYDRKQCQVTVFLILQRFCSGGDWSQTTTWWMCISATSVPHHCDMTASNLSINGSSFFFFHLSLLVLMFPQLCYSCLLHLVTGDITLAFPPWTKDDQCCATLPAAHTTLWHCRLAMMQCEVTDS